MITPNDIPVYQANLMSPPITPKLSSQVTKVVAGHDFVMLPPITTMASAQSPDSPTCPSPTSSSCSNTPDSLLSPTSSTYPAAATLPPCFKRKSSLVSALAAIQLDHQDLRGRPFQWSSRRPLFKQPRSKTTPVALHRRKCPFPRPSPAHTTPVSFCLDVFDPQLRRLEQSRYKKPRPSTASPPPPPLASPPSLPDPIPSSPPASPSLPASNPSPSPPAMTKPKADTSFFDHVDLSVPDHQVFTTPWLPSSSAFDQRPNIRVVWKGSPLTIKTLPHFDQLHANEQLIASTLRLSPEQYLKCKRALILTAQVYSDHGVPFRKSDAQKVCRIDVNKTSCLWNAFNRLGWFGPR
ncbi:hypothetical protein DM01DRAFT_1298037 [Hesseltinella vesiculosa]|uniref:SWIRM domain-containing protein n=1 Tax=Hesseltinella vesiculosa TaxID=101127 RepID=A0A1X2GYC9_9FUNG|nr:hypothetical protein DM01DRAFT_1298037 [Hesseltinella vesiculosa]